MNKQKRDSAHPGGLFVCVCLMCCVQINGKALSTSMMLKYLGLTVLHSSLETAERQVRNRVTLANKFVVKRLVFERLLYAEIWATENLRVQEVEQRIQSDIAATLNLFNNTLPNIISTLYAFGEMLHICGGNPLAHTHSLQRRPQG